MLAELVKLHTQDHLVHYGALYHPATDAPTRDLAVVLVHGLTGSFVGEVESALPPQLAAAGYACLVANNRGNGLLNAAKERFAGCLDDIQAALDFMAARGYTRIALLGHSKGAVKVSYFMTHQGSRQVVALGLLSPAADVHGIARWNAFQTGATDIDGWMQEMSRLVENGQGDTMFTFGDWPFLATAQMLSDHYATTDDDVLTALHSIDVPVLALCGALEIDWCTVVATLAESPRPNTHVAIIPNADHVYTGVEHELGHIILEWLANKGVVEQTSHESLQQPENDVVK